MKEKSGRKVKEQEEEIRKESQRTRRKKSGSKIKEDEREIRKESERTRRRNQEVK